jgi:hypothetical protein
LSELRFTPEEMDVFTKTFDLTPEWTGWQRADGEHGEDVLEIAVGSDGGVLRVAKTSHDHYVAKGFDGWALTISEDFSELMAILSNAASRQGNCETGSWDFESAA